MVRESNSSAQRVSSGTSYRPSWRTESSYEILEGATVGKTSVVAPPQLIDPNDRSVRRVDQGATSKELGSHKSGRENVRRSLNYSHATSRTEDSARIISELRREIYDLKQDARSRSPAKERPRNRVNASKRKNPDIPPCPSTRVMRIFLKLPAPSQSRDHRHLQRHPKNHWKQQGIHGLDRLSTAGRIPEQRHIPQGKLLVQGDSTQSGKLLTWCRPLHFLDK